MNDIDRLFFSLIRNKYLKSLIVKHVHSVHSKFRCIWKSRELQYIDCLVESKLIERIECINGHWSFDAIEYWTVRSLEYIVSNPLRYETLIYQLVENDKKSSGGGFQLPITSSVICKAIESAVGVDFSLVKYLMNNYRYSVSASCYCSAAARGRLDIIWHMLSNYPNVRIGRLPPVEAAAANQLETLIFFYRYHQRLLNESDVHYYDNAFKVELNGDVDKNNRVKSMFDNKVIFTYAVLDRAVGAGAVECVQYILENRIDGFTRQAIDGACQAELFSDRHFEAIRIARKTLHADCSESAVSGVIKHGRLDVLKYLHSQKLLNKPSNSEENNIVTSTAARYASLEMIRFLFDTAKYIPGKSMSSEVCKNGRLDVLQYMLENKKRFQVHVETTMPYMLMSAISAGQLAIVQLLLSIRWVTKQIRSEGSGKILASAAVDSCGLETLEYLLNEHKWMFPKTLERLNNLQLSPAILLAKVKLLTAHNIKFNVGGFNDLLAEHSLEIFKFFEQQYQPLPNSENYSLRAASKGRLDILKYLVGKGYDVHRYVLRVSNFETAKYLVEELNIRAELYIIEVIVDLKDIDMIVYLDKRFPGLSVLPCTISLYAAKGRLEILEYLLGRYIPPNEKPIDLEISMARNRGILTLLLSKRYCHLFKPSESLIHEIIFEDLVDSLMILLDVYNNSNNSNYNNSEEQSPIIFSGHTLLASKSLEVLLIQLKYIKLTKRLHSELMTLALSKSRFSIWDYLSNLPTNDLEP
ncbi:hypothetical protein PPL_09053 [Heterostelium album PN500]|uniref:Ankyrin repeat protein n=1 Tax=Heterostelium pallidum (strain ATCC 26659 / Pp 5 / PN500) TaxID=670386 RepID=D3BKH2_HETP5|nr:hypothetical protein PPL_09053 [Heterostelium album PN500]EFA78402.1 hypothetical protein PPL_09053 [Heterostelium album PN500]|eukprot:XP_020430527.1 hypothetical protein PPL_09053 [Heterostelium album PN500]